MKKLIWLMLLGMSSLIENKVQAQVSVNVNLGAQPLWGPVGYDRVDYYYLPDVDSYYSVPKRQFVYLSNGNWVFNNTLPARYSNYNLYNGYKVVLNGDRPYLNHNTHKVKYVKYKNWGGKQKAIKFSNDKKYHAAKGNVKGAPNGNYKKVANNSGGKGKGNGNQGKGKH